jgi:hypothetical protein
MDLQLVTNQTEETLSLSSVERYSDGSGFGTLLQVRSRGFEASAPFYFEPYALRQFLNDLIAMDQSLAGSAKLKPLYEDPFIELTLTRRGSVVVRGEVFEHSEHSQHLKFEFETDQTVLKPLIEAVRACLVMPPS